MKFFVDFLRMKAPKAGSEHPAYYTKALLSVEKLLALYFLFTFFLVAWGIKRWSPMPLVMLGLLALLIPLAKQLCIRVSMMLCALAVFLWCGWYIHIFGWGCGGQHFLLPLLILVFFNIYEPPPMKLGYFLALIAFRMLLFGYSLTHEPAFALDRTVSIVFQTFNSTMLFVILAVLCILFSTNLQDTERQLRIDNQELHREAGTDPLTQLPNRRAMLDRMDLFQKADADATFCVAIADIDFFKLVNDTYGHSCGDYTLKSLAELFRNATDRGGYSVCRWGGEEFCFFLPEMNLDQAGLEMEKLRTAVRRMALSFDGNDFGITITVGVEENDFASPMSFILEEADKKLYLGKNSGRNQVVL